MARYIDADNLEKEIKIDASESIARAVIRIIDRQPTADVEEVKHGEWQRQKNGFYFLCSVCGKAAATKGNYCHNCGAKMDGGNLS